MRTIRINRKRWARGLRNNKEGINIPNLLYDSSDNNACCLGHVIHQTTKCSWKALDQKYDPYAFFKKESILTKDAGFGDVTNNKLAEKAIDINDDYGISDQKREEKLTKLFAKHKIKLEFYN